MPKCHIGHHNFCEVPKLFGDHMHVHMHFSVATARASVFATFANKLRKITKIFGELDHMKSRGVLCQH
jgi:hypothetical protein